MAWVLGVTSSGFYAWLRRRQRSLSDDGQLRQVREIHRLSRGSYGAPRTREELVESGVRVGRKPIAHLMREARLAGISRRKGPRTTRRDTKALPAPHLVNRRFTADAPDRLWLAESPTSRPGRASCTWRSCSTPSAGGSWAGRWPPTCAPTWSSAPWRCPLTQQRPRGVVHYSDRGSQYLPGLQPTLPRNRRIPPRHLPSDTLQNSTQVPVCREHHVHLHSLLLVHVKPGSVEA